MTLSTMDCIYITNIHVKLQNSSYNTFWVNWHLLAPNTIKSHFDRSENYCNFSIEIGGEFRLISDSGTIIFVSFRSKFLISIVISIRSVIVKLIPRIHIVFAVCMLLWFRVIGDGTLTTRCCCAISVFR